MSFATADAAAETFYRAFANGDAVVMAALWLDDAFICCVHPARDPVIGHAAVMASWREILVEAGGFDITFQPGVRIGDDDLVIHVGIERLTTGDGEVALLSVTNAFRRTAEGWRMVLHHAAPVQQPLKTAAALH